MTPKKRTGSVTGKTISAGNITTGLKFSGAASDAVLQNALDVLQHLDTGDVQAEEGVKASGDITTGIDIDLQIPDRETFLAKVEELQQMLADLQQHPEVAEDASLAAESLDTAVVEAKKDEPRAKLIVRRLRETLELLTDAGKALETADKIGPLILKAIPVAATLYKAAQVLFQAHA